VIGDDDGVFGCMSLLACHDVCPKELPLATQIAFMRRKMAAKAGSRARAGRRKPH
jgi:fumarate reductase iron-sulfur subunit